MLQEIVFGLGLIYSTLSTALMAIGLGTTFILIGKSRPTPDLDEIRFGFAFLVIAAMALAFGAVILVIIMTLTIAITEILSGSLVLAGKDPAFFKYLLKE